MYTPHLHTPVDTLKWLRGVNLADGGTITVAFPSDEKFINSIHRHKHSESDILPPASELAAWLRLNGLSADVASALKQVAVFENRCSRSVGEYVAVRHDYCALTQPLTISRSCVAIRQVWVKPASLSRSSRLA